MGGRGASSNSTIQQIIVTRADGGKSIFRQGNGFVINMDTNQQYEMSLNEVINRARASGATVQTYNQKQLNDYEKNWREERRQASEQLDRLYFDNPQGKDELKRYRNHLKAQRISKRNR